MWSNSLSAGPNPRAAGKAAKSVKASPDGGGASELDKAARNALRFQEWQEQKRRAQVEREEALKAARRQWSEGRHKEARCVAPKMCTEWCGGRC